MISQRSASWLRNKVECLLDFEGNMQWTTILVDLCKSWSCTTKRCLINYYLWEHCRIRHTLSRLKTNRRWQKTIAAIKEGSQDLLDRVNTLNVESLLRKIECLSLPQRYWEQQQEENCHCLPWEPVNNSMQATTSTTEHSCPEEAFLAKYPKDIFIPR